MDRICIECLKYVFVRDVTIAFTSAKANGSYPRGMGLLYFSLHCSPSSPDYGAESWNVVNVDEPVKWKRHKRGRTAGVFEFAAIETDGVDHSLGSFSWLEKASVQSFQCARFLFTRHEMSPRYSGVDVIIGSEPKQPTAVD